MTSLLEYKCPCCDASIDFDSSLQKMKCPYCGTEFDVETLAAYNDELSEEHAEKDGSSNIVQSVIINLVIGFVIAFIVTSVMKSSLKSVRMQPMASGYMKNDSFNITRSNDLFLYRTVSRTPRANSSSVGSGTRTSSSGRSHGGGRF